MGKILIATFIFCLLFITRAGDLLLCSANILGLTPEFKKYSHTVKVDNFSAAIKNLQFILSTSLSVSSSCSFHQTKIGIHMPTFKGVLNADPSLCKTSLEEIATDCKKILANPTNFTQDLVIIQKIYQLAPQTLEDCGVSVHYKPKHKELKNDEYDYEYEYKFNIYTHHFKGYYQTKAFSFEKNDGPHFQGPVLVLQHHTS